MPASRSVLLSGCEDLLYTLKASLRAAAYGGRPRAGNHTTATRGTASPLLLDGFVHMPEVSTAHPFRMGLVLVVAVLRKTTYSFLLLDAFMRMPEVSPVHPFGMTLMVRALVDPHRPHLPRRYANRRRRPTPRPSGQSSQQVGPSTFALGRSLAETHGVAVQDPRGVA
jgi:hypothetical protein